MAYSEQDDDMPDVMRLKIGNLLPADKISLEFTYVQQLEVCVNRFWRLTLPATMTPRYRSRIIPKDKWPEMVKKCIANTPEIV